MKTILIFEPLFGGHQAGFIRWLTDAIRGNPPSGCRFVFVVDPRAEGIASGEVVFQKIPAAAVDRLAAAGRWNKSWLLWKLFRDSCNRYRPDHALILELTHLELALALCGAPCPISAILFVQYPELPRGLKFVLKDWKTALLLRRVSVKNLFLLNGGESCRYLAGRFGSRTRFVPIPDPAPALTEEAGYSLREAYRVDPARMVFLFFGAISPRKGADVLIEALHLLSPEAAARSAFVFCGKPEHGYREAFEAACVRLRQGRPDIQLHMEDRFVSDGRMMSLFEQTDVILMPYTRPEYSSGVLALAAKAGTPVIGPEGGLLGRLIRQNGLGVGCPVCPEKIAGSIEDATQRPLAVDETRCEAFVRQSRTGIFGRAIIDAIRNEV